jgi:hypothetical protein
MFAETQSENALVDQSEFANKMVACLATVSRIVKKASVAKEGRRETSLLLHF